MKLIHLFASITPLFTTTEGKSFKRPDIQPILDEHGLSITKLKQLEGVCTEADRERMEADFFIFISFTTTI